MCGARHLRYSGFGAALTGCGEKLVSTQNSDPTPNTYLPRPLGGSAAYLKLTSRGQVTRRFQLCALWAEATQRKLHGFHPKPSPAAYLPTAHAADLGEVFSPP